MCSYLLLALTFAGLTFLAAGCSAEDKASTIPQEAAAQAIRSQLQSAGFEAEWASFRWRADFFGASVRQATLSVDGPNGSHVQFYRFDEAGQAAEAAAGVSPDGNSVPADGGTAMVSWIGPPHFFRQGRLVVLFAEGDGVHTSGSRDRSVLATLGEVMGPQFAGASLPNE